MPGMGPIILIDDDGDDIYIFKTLLSRLETGREFETFTTAAAAFNYLKQTTEKPFLIICHLSIGIGINHKKDIDSTPELRRKSIPFIYYFASQHPDKIENLYEEANVQGVFIKSGDVNEMKTTLKTKITYWELCVQPTGEPL